jgi:cysteine desulfurase
MSAAPLNSVYLDYNATAPVRPEAIAAMTRVMGRVGNPSSTHAAGRAARAEMEAAREAVAALVGAPPANLVFTSGGTEASNLAIASAVAAGAKRLIVSAIEHDCIHATAQASDAAVEIWPVSADGVADLAWLDARLAAWDAADGAPFVALMLANNETGVIQPLAEAAQIVRAAGGWLHVDAVQAAGKIAIDMGALGADTLAVSAHKIGGPQGAGALAFGPRATLFRRQHGGGQERGRRGGTENLPGIAGFGAAASAALRDLPHYADQAAWRDAAIERLRAAAPIKVFGANAPRLANTLCFAAPGGSSETLVMALDLDGVMVSAGSACSSGKVKASPVLAAMGETDLAGAALRVSGGWASTETDWVRFTEAWLSSHARLQSRQRVSAA